MTNETILSACTSTGEGIQWPWLWKFPEKWSTYCWLLCDKVLHYSSWAFNGGCYDTFTWYMNMILALEMHFHLSSVNLLCICWRITLLRVSTYVLRMKRLPNKALPLVPTKRHEHLTQIKIRWIYRHCSCSLNKMHILTTYQLHNSRMQKTSHTHEHTDDRLTASCVIEKESHNEKYEQ